MRLTACSAGPILLRFARRCVAVSAMYVPARACSAPAGAPRPTLARCWRSCRYPGCLRPLPIFPESLRAEQLCSAARQCGARCHAKSPRSLRAACATTPAKTVAGQRRAPSARFRPLIRSCKSDPAGQPPRGMHNRRHDNGPLAAPKTRRIVHTPYRSTCRSGHRLPLPALHGVVAVAHCLGTMANLCRHRRRWASLRRWAA